jgi:hypothetical protein
MTRIGFLERLRKFALRFELKGLHTGASPWHRLMAFFCCAAALVLVFR